MGSISGGNYISTYSGDQIDGILGKANTYPAATAQDAGKVPTVQNDGTIALSTPAAGGVTSFNGRTGAVTPQSGDYTATMVGAATDPPYVPITLAAANWSNGSQTVTVAGVSATETDQLIQPVPALVSQSAYLAAGILVTAQAANSLTFTCSTTPSSDLTVYVVLTELEAAT